MINRRTFLQTIGALALAPRSQADSDWGLHYMLASSMYGNLPLSQIIAEVKRTGASSIELWPKIHGTQREELDSIGTEAFQSLLKQHGVLFGGTTRFDLGPLRLDQELEVVKQLGGSLIVVGAGKPTGLAGPDLREAIRAFTEKLKPVAAKAATLGITVAIENHANTLIESPDSLFWLAEMAVPGTGIALAPYHLPQNSAQLAQIVRTIGSKLSLFYAWEYGKGCHKPLPKDQELQQLPGRGPLDWKPILAALKSIQFNGPTEIFMHPTPRGFPILETAELVTNEINRARTYLDSLVKEL